MPETALIAMSGGVDSSAAVFLLREKGFDCRGVTFKLYDDAAENDAREAASRLGITHHVLDLRETFRDKVILPFIETYEKGDTPNPCVSCNRHIKFAFNLFRAAGLIFDIYATGHYAQIEKSGSRWLLKKAKDQKKDQSYVLFSLDQEKLARLCFPLGGMTKSETRQIALEHNLINAGKKESQDICFVSDGDHGVFIEEYTGKRYPHGDILGGDGTVIGRHNGIVRYTLGQRRGLGVALNQPLYVSALDAARNTVRLGPESSLYSKTLVADRINLIACDSLEKPVKVKVKTRYMQREHPALAVQRGPDEIHIEFEEAQRAVTPGQAAVLYDGDIVIGGGIIR